MGLSSVMQTALSGISAAEFSIGAIANNLANSQTDGFKQSQPRFATQAPQTIDSGAPPSTANGGTNPLQIGSGVAVSGNVADFSQGSLVPTGNTLDVALEGNGFLIVEGGGERLFTRGGKLSLNAAGELVTSDGHRVLGFSVDRNFNLQTSELSALTISLGQAAPGAQGNAAHLASFSIGNDGTISGHFSDGQLRTLGQIRVARFANPGGLQARAGGLYAAGPNSGLPVASSPGAAGTASLISGSRELSNTDVGQNIVNLILAENQFSSSLFVLNAADAMLFELIDLQRR